MTLSSNPLHYEDIRIHLDRALTSERGIKIICASPGQAIHMKQRLYKLRQLDKIASLDLWPVGDDRRGTTVYENLFIEVKPGSTEVVITHRASIKVEEL